MKLQRPNWLHRRKPCKGCNQPQRSREQFCRSCRNILAHCQAQLRNVPLIEWWCSECQQYHKI